MLLKTKYVTINYLENDTIITLWFSNKFNYLKLKCDTQLKLIDNFARILEALNIKFQLLN